jgi:hypothetical protein
VAQITTRPASDGAAFHRLDVMRLVEKTLRELK